MVVQYCAHRKSVQCSLGPTHTPSCQGAWGTLARAADLTSSSGTGRLSRCSETGSAQVVGTEVAVYMCGDVLLWARTMVSTQYLRKAGIACFSLFSSLFRGHRRSLGVAMADKSCRKKEFNPCADFPRKQFGRANQTSRNCPFNLNCNRGMQ